MKSRRQSNEKDLKVRLIALTLFIFFISIYLLTSAGLNFYYIDTSVMRLQVAKSIVESSDLSVPQGIRGADGRKYSWYGIGVSLLAVPFYIMGKLIGIPAAAIALMNQLFGAATAVLVFLFSVSLGYSRRASLLVSIFCGLGTMGWPIAKHPFDNIIETFFILFSVYCMYLYVSDRKMLNLFLSAVLFGVAFITRMTSILVAPALLIIMVFYSVKSFDRRTAIKIILRDGVFFAIVFLPFIVLSLWYNYYRFDSIFETGYQLFATRAEINLFRGTSFLTGLIGLLISPGKGVFYYSPVAILFFFSIKSFMKRHRGLGISFIFIMISYILLHSKYFYWHGDWAWGPRYLLVIIPFLTIAMGEIFDSSMWVKRKVLRTAVYTIFTVSLIVQIASVSVDFRKYFLDLQFEEGIDFNGTYVDDIPTSQPPEETYFNVRRSPIPAQFKSIYTIAKEIKDYRFSMPPADASKAEKASRMPIMNIFDFWWLHRYFTEGSSSGFIIAPVLFLISIYSGVKLYKLSRRV